MQSSEENIINKLYDFLLAVSINIVLLQAIFGQEYLLSFCFCSSAIIHNILIHLYTVYASMVLFFVSSDRYTIYMGADKYENEDLIKFGLPEDVWYIYYKYS